MQEQEQGKLQWEQLLSAKRQRESSKSSPYDSRSPFEKDYHRIILSASFRRLQDKTQVFPLDQSDFVRTRLTHSLEVSSLAKSLGELVAGKLQQVKVAQAPSAEEQKYIGDILLCAGLLHDIGNPPFGHYGETTIKDWYKKNLPRLQFRNKPLTAWLSPQMEADLENFEGNAQALRLVTKLHYLVDDHGLNLSYALLNTIMKYPVNSLMVDPSLADRRYKKLGYFYAEQELFQEITKATGTARPYSAQDEPDWQERVGENQLVFGPEFSPYDVCRHPLTYLLEAADDISYRTADLEDASRKGKITYLDLIEYFQHYPQLAKYPQKLQTDYQRLVTNLKQQFARMSADKSRQKPGLYAIQNWLVEVQNQLIASVCDAFITNYEAIMYGQYPYDLFHNNLAGLVLTVLGDLAYDYVFSSMEIVELEVAADAIIGGLLDKFVPACLNFATDQEQAPVEERLMALISDNYRANYFREAAGKSEGEQLYLRLLLVNDYICGMTDSFAKTMYYKFNGIY